MTEPEVNLNAHETKTEIEVIARREAKNILLRLFAPVLVSVIMVGVGAAAGIYLSRREADDRRRSDCIQDAQDRADLRLGLETGPFVAIDDIIAIFPQDDPNVIAARQANQDGRERLLEALPPLDPTDC